MLINEFLQTGELDSVHSGKIIQGNNPESSKVFDFIKQHCTEFLDTGPRKNKKLLYRGYGFLEHKDTAFVGSSRDRRSITLHAESAQELCDAYLKAGGFSALRSNSIFCNSDYFRAKSFGNAFSIFPINGFKFTYCASMTGHSATQYTYPNGIETINEAPGDPKEFKLYAKKFIALNDFQRKNIKYATAFDLDIWFSGKYIALNMDKFVNAQQILKGVL